MAFQLQAVGSLALQSFFNIWSKDATHLTGVLHPRPYRRHPTPKPAGTEGLSPWQDSYRHTRSYKPHLMSTPGSTRDARHSPGLGIGPGDPHLFPRARRGRWAQAAAPPLAGPVDLRYLHVQSLCSWKPFFLDIARGKPELARVAACETRVTQDHCSRWKE